MVSHALWDTLQKAVIVPIPRHVGPENRYTHSSCPAQYFIRGIKHTKTNSLGREIKSTFADTAAAIQPPQSGIGWETTLGSPNQSEEHDRCYNHPH